MGGGRAAVLQRSKMKMIDVTEVDTLNKEHAKRDDQMTKTEKLQSRKRKFWMRQRNKDWSVRKKCNRQRLQQQLLLQQLLQLRLGPRVELPMPIQMAPLRLPYPMPIVTAMPIAMPMPMRQHPQSPNHRHKSRHLSLIHI